MAKDKKASKAVAVAPKPHAGKPTHSVKAGRVTKPADQPKAVAKESAKKTAHKVEKKSKKVKEPTPEPSSEEDETSASSASSEESDSGSEAEVKAKPQTNGNSKIAAAKNGKSHEDETSEGTSSASSDDDDDDDDEEGGPEVGAAKEMDDQSSDSASSSDDDEDSKEPKAKSADVGMADAEGSSAGSSSEEDDSEDEEEAAAPPKVAEKPVKKRKAEEAIDQTPKKTKVMVNGEEKEAVGNLFVGNLSWNVDEEWLTREFEEYGELQGVRIITDRDTGRSKGYGYVEFVSADSAVAAIEAKQGFEMDGRGMRLDFSHPRPERGDGATPQQRGSERAQKYGDVPKEPSDTLFVGNLSFDVDESTLSEYFQEHGSVQSIRLPTDRETGNPKGFGYVQFTSIDDAKTAFDALQGADVMGRAMRLDFASAKPPTDGSRGGFGGRGGGGGGRGRGGFGDRGGRGGGRGFGDRGRGGRGRGGDRGGRGGSSFNRGGFGDFSGKKTTF